MRIKSKPTFDAKYAAACKRMEAEKQMEIRESKKLYDLRRQLGSKKHEGRVGAKSRLAVMNAVATEGKEVLTDAGEGFWRDMQRRYHWQAEDGNWEDGSSANGTRNHYGKVRERYRAGRWEHWDAKKRDWVPGEITKRRGFAK